MTEGLSSLKQLTPVVWKNGNSCLLLVHCLNSRKLRRYLLLLRESVRIGKTYGVFRILFLLQVRLATLEQLLIKITFKRIKMADKI